MACIHWGLAEETEIYSSEISEEKPGGIVYLFIYLFIVGAELS